MSAGAPVLPASVLVVPPAWCDYNEHFSDGYYLVAFSTAAETALDAVGLGARYRARGHHSAYTVESQVRYLREGKAGDALTIRHAVQAFDAKRFWLRQEMHRGDTLLATCTFVYLHVDTTVPRAAPFPPEVLERLAAYAGGPARGPAAPAAIPSPGGPSPAR
jgi:acyl-CoA thioesterase FadM